MGDQPWPKTTFYVSTTDIDASLEEAGKLGGRTLMPRTELPGGTILAFLADPEGNAVGLPLAAFFWGKVWTLAAWCELREDFRTFRLDRMDRIEAGEPFEEESGRSLRDYLRNIGPGAERLLD